MPYSIEAGGSGWGWGDVEGGQVTSLDAGVSVWKGDGEMSSLSKNISASIAESQDAKNAFSSLESRGKIHNSHDRPAASSGDIRRFRGCAGVL